MPYATPELIEQFFEDYGWNYERIEPTIWRTGFRGRHHTFRINLQITTHWLYIGISPFVLAPLVQELEQRAPRLFYYLMRLNHDMNMAKFTLDEDGDIRLAAELPTENLDYSEFVDALNMVAQYADDFFVEVLNLAHGDGTAARRYDAPAPSAS